jgi:hypothetical protein
MNTLQSFYKQNSQVPKSVCDNILQTSLETFFDIEFLGTPEEFFSDYDKAFNIEKTDTEAADRLPGILPGFEGFNNNYPLIVVVLVLPMAKLAAESYFNGSQSNKSKIVKHWNASEIGEDQCQNFQMDVDDQRDKSGQIYIDLAPVDSMLDDALSLVLEVSSQSENYETHTQALHVSLNYGDNVMSLYKMNDKLLIEINGGSELSDESKNDIRTLVYDFSED